MNNIILIGLKSCGKTTLGKLFCAQNPQYHFIDTDDLIKQQHQEPNLSTGEIYQQLGDEGFRELEAKVIKDLADSLINGLIQNNVVIATGGGSVLNSENILNLKKIGRILYLECHKQVIYQRWCANNIQPNFITNDYTFDNYIQDRSSLYQQAADKVFNVTNLKLTEVCDFGE